MKEMKTLNGYEVVDEKARTEIEALKALVNSGGDGVSGTWYFNESITHANVEQVTWNVNFTCKGKSYTTITDVGVMPEMFFGSDTSYMSGEWQDEAYRTINIAEGQDLPADFVAWLKANAKQTETTDVSVSGTWYFNEVISFPDSVTWNVNFTYDDTNKGETESTSIYCEPAMNEISYSYEMVYSSGWADECYRTITIAEGQDLDADFVAWLKANATKQ